MSQNIAPSAHSAIGASSMSRLIACPGSFRLSQQVRGGGGTTIYAATGTVAHALAEEAMTDGYDPGLAIGKVVTVDGHGITVTQEMVDAVSVYMDLVASWKQHCDWLQLEVQVCLDPYWAKNEAPPVSAFGTADALAYYAQRFHLDVGDYKNGAGVFVEVVDNPQVLYYAAGALLKLRALGHEVRTVSTHIVQPNVHGAEKIRSDHITAADVLMWVHEVLKPTVAEAMKPNAPLAAGKHCRFCPARVGCPARNKLRQDAAKRDFGPNNAKLVDFSPAALSDALAELEILEDHAKALREHAMTRIAAGEKVPAWDIEPTRPTRSWDKTADPDDFAKRIAAITGSPLNRIRSFLLAPPVLRTPAQMVKAIPLDWWGAIEDQVISKSSGVKLVHRPGDPTDENSTRSTPQKDFA
jgi:hypothetical protein